MLKGLSEEQLISYVQEPRPMDRPMDRMGGYGRSSRQQAMRGILPQTEAEKLATSNIVPTYMVLGEIERRKANEAKAQAQEADKPPIAEQIVQEAMASTGIATGMPQGVQQGMPQGVQQAMPPAMPQEIITDTIAETGIAANDPQNIGMAQGGIVGYAGGGGVGDYLPYYDLGNKDLNIVEDDIRIDRLAADGLLDRRFFDKTYNERIGGDTGIQDARDQILSDAGIAQYQGLESSPGATFQEKIATDKGLGNVQAIFPDNLRGGYNISAKDEDSSEVTPDSIEDIRKFYADIDESVAPFVGPTTSENPADEDFILRDEVLTPAGKVQKEEEKNRASRTAIETKLAETDSLRAEKARVDEQMQRGLSYDNYMASLGPATEDDYKAAETALSRRNVLDKIKEYGDFDPEHMSKVFGAPDSLTAEEYKERIEDQRKTFGLDRTDIESRRASLQAMQQAANDKRRRINAPLAALKGFLALASSDNTNFVQAASDSALGAVTAFMEGDAQIQLADLQMEQNALSYAEGDYNTLEKDYEKYEGYKKVREKQYIDLLKDYYAGLKAAAGKNDTLVDDALKRRAEYLANNKDINLTSFFNENYIAKGVYEANLFNHFYSMLAGAIPKDTPVPQPMGGGTGQGQVQKARRKEFETYINPAEAKKYNIPSGNYTRDENGRPVLIDEDLENVVN